MSTTLQTHAFPQVDGYAGKFYENSDPAGYTDAWSFLDEWFDDYSRDGLRHAERLYNAISSQTSSFNTLISNERFACWPCATSMSKWPVEDGWASVTRTEAWPLLGLLRGLKERFRGTIDLQVILTLRNQVDFLSSLYVELSPWMQSPSLSDFQNKARALANPISPMLDYHKMVQGLEREIKSVNLLVLIHEDGLQNNIKRIGEFIQFDFDISRIDAWRENVKRRGKYQWQSAKFRPKPLTQRGIWLDLRRQVKRFWPASLSGIGGVMKLALALVDSGYSRHFPRQNSEGLVLEVPDQLASEMRARFGPSNGQLMLMLGRNLSSMGY